jgi:hypothetical protein
MLPSVEEMGGKLSEGMGAIEFRLNVVRPIDFRLNDVWPIDLRANDVRPIDLWANDVWPMVFRENVVLSKIDCEDAAIIS